MAVMTTKTSIITACYDIITEDSEIQSHFTGGVALALDEAHENQRFPYLVHSLSVKPVNWPIVNGLYAVSCYSAGRKVDTCAALAQRIQELFQWRSLETEEAKIGRFFYVDDLSVDTGDKEVWRMDVIFDFRFYDQKTALAVINR